MQTPASKALKYLKDLAATIGTAEDILKEAEKTELQEATGVTKSDVTSDVSIIF